MQVVFFGIMPTRNDLFRPFLRTNWIFDPSHTTCAERTSEGLLFEGRNYVLHSMSLWICQNILLLFDNDISRA
jgi:hypothetical protein